MFLFSVFCVVLALEFAVTTPQGNRFNESHIQNEANSNEFIPQEKQNEDYEKIVPNNNPIAFSNFYEQSNVISEKKEQSHNTEKKFNTLNDDSSSSSYIASLPQVNRFQTFRPKDGVNNEANIPRMGDILSEVNNPNNEFSRIESNAPIIKERTPDNQVIYEYNRQNSPIPENLNEKKEEENSTEFDVPVATPEYIKSLLNEYKHAQNSNVKSTITNSPRNDINYKNFQRNSQNMNEATFQNPSAEILYETGKAKPYEISNEQLFNSRRGKMNNFGNKHIHNILQDKQKLKNLYLSSKPTKHYMIVYPDGRVEEVDRLDKIKKIHPNYVMLNAKELLQHGEAHKKVSTGSQRSIMKQSLSNTSATMKPQLNTIKDTKDDQIDKVPQTVDAQAVSVPIERLSNVTEHNIISTANIIKTNNVAKTSKDEVLITSTAGNNIQKQLQENGSNDSQEKNEININENTNSGSNVKTSDISNTPVKANKDIEENATTVRSTKSVSIDDTDILNQNISKSLATSNNTDEPKLSKEQENINNTSASNFLYTQYESIVADTSNSSASLETYREESNSFSKLNNETMITFEDGKDSDGNPERIITNNNYENNAQNLGSNIVTSYDRTMFVTTTNKTDIDNTSSDDIQDAKPFNVNSSNSLTNKTLVINEKPENNVNTTTIQTESNITNSEVDETKNDDNNLKPHPSDIYSDATYINAFSSKQNVNNTQNESNLIKILKENVKKDGSKYAADDGSETLTVNPDLSNTINKASDTLNSGAVPSNEEDTVAPDTASNNLYYSNSPQKEEIEDDIDDIDDEDDDDKYETISETTKANDNLELESLSNGNGGNESSFWFNANESFWNKLMSSNEHNSFYFLFPRPKPNTKETKKTIYPNGTVVIETTETDDDDGEITSSKTVLMCGNFTCDQNEAEATVNPLAVYGMHKL